ncbi:MAG: FAD-binding oxidoreductase [bacterium]|nr:FAD-binding oxidoreductase [bacterium]
MSPFTKIDDRHLRALREILGPDGVRRDEIALDRYGRDETENLHFPPEVVVLPTTPDEVSRIMELAHREHLPVTPRGGGTGLSGGALPVAGGIVLAVERLNRIRTIDTRDLVAEAEAGVVTGVLQARGEELDLCYPPDPASRDTCLLAGNLAEDSAGPRSCKYGSTRKYVLGLEAVLADGTLIRTGGRNRKDAAGYNLTQLLVGSEGTLAVITAATLRLIPKPRAKLTVLLPFPDLEEAAAAIETLFREGHDPAACELLDEGALQAVAQVMELPAELRGHKALIVLELDGNDPETLLEEAVAIGELAERLGGGEAIASQDAAEQRRLWEIRSKVGEAVKHGSVYKEADAVVPRSKLAELVRAARATAHHHGLEAVCYGHAGDGNLHVNLLRGSLSDDAWVERRTAAETELFRRVVALGGSVTGEHGIGWSQRAFLPLAVEPPVLALLQQLKTVFDPTGILNPGKIFLPTP